MNIREIRDILKANVWTGAEKLDREVHSACGCDLMSDVLAFAKEEVLLLTGLINPQVIRTAEMMDIKAIVFVRGKTPTADMIHMAHQKSMILLSTDYPLYIACGELYQLGLMSKGDN